MALLWPDQKWPVKVVPCASTPVQAPLPSSAKRCFKLGGPSRAVASWHGSEGGGSWNRRSVASVGWRAGRGFINKAFDLQFMDSMVSDPTWRRSRHLTLVGQTGHVGRTARWAGGTGRARSSDAQAATPPPRPDLQHGVRLMLLVGLRRQILAVRARVPLLYRAITPLARRRRTALVDVALVGLISPASALGSILQNPGSGGRL